MQASYKCHKLVNPFTATQTRTTGCFASDLKLNYLNRHPMACPHDYVLTAWRFHQGTCPSGQGHMSYACGQVTGRLYEHETVSRGCGAVGHDISYLDRQGKTGGAQKDVCPEGKLLTGWRLVESTCAAMQMRLEYPCMPEIV